MPCLWRCLSGSLLAAVVLTLPAAAHSPDRSDLARLRLAQARLPLHFEPNRGQADASVKFRARGPGYGLDLTPAGAVLALGPTRLTMRLSGAQAAPAIEGQDPLPGRVNYLVGHDPARWRTGIPTYAKVAYRDVYPGVDLVFYGNQRQVEYDFVVAPGADPSAIRLAFEGAESVTLDQGDLVLGTPAGVLRMARPRLYQDVDGARRTIGGGYRLEGHEVGFAVGDYDRSRPLVIDPLPSYFNDIGVSSSDAVVGVVDGGEGRVYIAGNTAWPYDYADESNAFVAELDAATGAMVQLAYVAGSRHDEASAIARDAAGNVYVAGWTTSPDFPTTAGAFQNAPGPGFVAKLDGSLSTLRYSTFFPAAVGAMTVDAAGNAYLGGAAGSGFPTTPGAFQRTFMGGANPSGNPQFGTDAFVTKLTPDGSALVYSTYLGGAGSDFVVGIALDAAAQAVVVGAGGGPASTTGSAGDGFVAKLTADGSGLVYSTGIGNDFSGKYAPHRIGGLAVDGAGAAYVVGRIGGVHAGDLNGLVTTPGAFQEAPRGGGDAFVLKLDGAGAVVYATYLGGSSRDEARAIAVDQAGRAWITGYTWSADFPTAVACAPAGCHADTTLDGSSDAFVAILDPTGSSLVYGALLGGSGAEAGAAIAIQDGEFALVGGSTTSADFWSGGYRGGGSDGFVARLRVMAPAGPGPGPGLIPSLALSLGKTSFHPGETFQLAVTAANPGPGQLVDVFLGALLPSDSGPAFGCPAGDPIAFLADGFTRIVVTCLSASPQGFPPLFQGTILPAALPATSIPLSTLQWPAGAPPGAYTFFLVLTPPNAFTDGRVDPTDFVALTTTSVVLAP